jgi:leader peptidase (prepilin peptidase)/N-methyltransferase
MQNLIFFLCLVFGSAIGSFLNVVILRLPAGEKLTGRSHCTNCGHTLGALDLFPILSFALLRGKCRYCGHKISPRYFIIEAATGILFALAYLAVSPSSLPEAAMLAIFFLAISVCVITFVVDLEHYIILENVVLPAAGVVLLAYLVLDLAAGRSLFSAPSLFVSGLGGAALGALPIYILWYASKWKTGETGRWMGFGDVELMLFLGAFTGLPLVGLVLFIGVLLGGVISVFLLIAGKKGMKSQVPFGTFLVPGAIITMFYGEKILSWYLAILGF